MIVLDYAPINFSGPNIKHLCLLFYAKESLGQLNEIRTRSIGWVSFLRCTSVGKDMKALQRLKNTKNSISKKRLADKLATSFVLWNSLIYFQISNKYLGLWRTLWIYQVKCNRFIFIAPKLPDISSQIQRNKRSERFVYWTIFPDILFKF